MVDTLAADLVYFPAFATNSSACHFQIAHLIFFEASVDLYRLSTTIPPAVQNHAIESIIIVAKTPGI